ncbi:MAG TPA: hypothetical protein VGM90_01490 [Kofleriaceae bacterium]|jgi:hypothetical protein
MATVFALILLPAMFAVGALVLAVGSGVGSVLAALTFVALAAGVFGGLYRLAQQWEEQPVD